jgi:WXXGXW repeat (2 copies)
MTPKKQIKRATPSLLVLATCALVGCAGEPTTVTTTTTREVTTTGPATREVLVTQAPPVVRVETQPVSPGPGYIWTRGYWRWTGAQYVWVPGTWIARRTAAAVWVEGHWLRRPGGWVWIAGHWR